MEAGYVSKLHSNTQILQNPVMSYLFTKWFKNQFEFALSISEICGFT
jgi:hypothetical protein